MQDLEGITVVSLEQAVAAPYVSGRLAEAGARVIKIERSEGDFARQYDDFVFGESAYFVWLNGGKESITMDIKDPDDHALLGRMLTQADVFIQNLAPGALARLGLAPEVLREKFPSLIICSISGYGEDGPYRDQKAYDLLIQAETGLCAITGVGDELTRVGVSVSDISAGMTAYQAILEALFARERDPDRAGRQINVSLFHSTADWMTVPYFQHHYGNFTPQNHGLKHPSIAPYGAYLCKDDKAVLISIQSQREWRALCEKVMGNAALADHPDYATNADRIANRPALDGLVGDFFKALSREEVIKKLNDGGIAFGRLSDLDDLANHPQNRFREIVTENGVAKALGRGAEIEGKMDKQWKLPALGEHNEKIRQEFSK